MIEAFIIGVAELLVGLVFLGIFGLLMSPFILVGLAVLGAIISVILGAIRSVLDMLRRPAA